MSNPKNVNLYAVMYEPTLQLWIAVGAFDGTDCYILTSAEPPGIWTERSNPLTGGSLGDITSNGSGLIVAVGTSDSGDAMVITSTDGINWTQQSNPLNDSLFDVCHGNGLFVAVGGYPDPKIMTSPDGITWTIRNPAAGISGNINAVCFNGSVFCAVGNDGEIQTSVDGIIWTIRSTLYGYDLFGVAADSDTGIIVTGGNQGELTISSYNGVTWQKLPTLNFGSTNNEIIYQAIAFGGGRFAGCGIAGSPSYASVAFYLMRGAVG